MLPAALHDDVVDAALSTAATLLDMEVVFLGLIDGEYYRFARVVGDHPRITAGRTVELSTTMCRQMLDGAPAAVDDAASDPAYAAAPARVELGVTSYVGVPIHDRTGRTLGTLCGVDRGAVPVTERVVEVLRDLAGLIAARLATAPQPDHVVIRRTPSGWSVADGAHDESLTCAMVLADLLAEDVAPGPRPERAASDLDETERLKASVAQLEHALAARVVVEQAIGVLAERSAAAPRDAFELLRKVARRDGRRVHDLAREVVSSVTDRAVVLPEELTAG